MPVNVDATTRRSRAKNGAMNDHQSACAAPPWEQHEARACPRPPQASVSTRAPLTSTNVRSGSSAIASSNQIVARRLQALIGQRRQCVGSFTRGPLSSRDLEQPGRAHAAADAHRHHDVAHAAPLALDQRVADQARARSCRRDGRPRSRRR